MSKIVLFVVALFIVGCASKGVVGGDQRVESIKPPSIAKAPQHSDSSLATGKARDNMVDIGLSVGATLGNVYFDFDRYNIRPDMTSVIDDAFNKLRNSDARVVIEGNTDEFGSDEYNYALGARRALVVKNALISKGINASRIDTKSFGESNPVCKLKTKECHDKNRRASIVVAR